MSALPGVDADAVSKFFAEYVEGGDVPLQFSFLSGGRSNLTYRVEGGRRTWVLRRPPLGFVLPTAHDMAREHRVLTALHGTGVPVPRTRALCTDETVTGAPFYVMGFVDGVILRDAGIAEKVYDEATRRRAGEQLIDVLADLHAVDVDAVGLGDLARKEGYIGRQLKRWYSQFQQSAAMGGRTVPAIDEMHAFLSERIPEQGAATVVHGDYRLDNTVFDDAGTVLAVLDWEICTLGDPMADLGLLMVYWAEPGEDPPLGVAPTAVAGFPKRDELRDRYAARSGRDVSQLDFYVSFGYWKLACILEGVYARYAGGASGGDAAGWETFGLQVERLGDWAKAAAEKL